LPKPAPASTNGLWHILVVDSEADAAEQCATALRDAGYAVGAACSATEALERMRERPADLVLTDMALAADSPPRGQDTDSGDSRESVPDAFAPPVQEATPQMDGMQLLANLKEMYPDTCVVIMASAGTIWNAMEAMRRGADDVLPKPFEQRDLQRIVASCLTAMNSQRYGAFVGQTSAMLELTRALSKSADSHALPQQSVEMARKNFESDSAILYNYEPVQDALFVVAHAGRMMTRRGHADSLTEQCLGAVRKKAVLLETDARSGDCYAFLPLLVAERPRGLLCLCRSGGPAFRENAVEIMEMFASHLAVTLESARLYETAAEQVAELEELVTVSRSLALNADKDRMRRQLLASTARLTACEICAVLLLTDRGTALQTAPALPEDSPAFQAIQAAMSAVMGAAPGAGLGRLPLDARHSLASSLTAPMTAGDKQFGLLAAFSSRANAFTTEDARRLTALAEGASAAADNAEMLSRVSLMYQETLEFFAAMVDARCAHTQGHSSQVRTYAGELARVLNRPPREVYLIEDAALLHDVGKVCVPDALLCKPGPLTLEEFGIIAAHPVIGAAMFSRTVHLQELAPIVRHHHEHFDGRGYPDKLRGKDIPLGARIVSIGDVFDALVSHRVYRPAMDFAKARSMLAERAGSQFDPELIQVFLSLGLEKMTEH